MTTNPTRRPLLSALVALPALALLAPAFLIGSLRAQEGGQPQEEESPFVVHEWGTFTSMQGSDGYALEGLHHEEEALPEFVHDATTLLDLGSAKHTKFPASHVLQKMETPVIYFYSDVRREVEVDVYYPKGLLTQYFPAPDILSPRLSEIRERIAGGRIDFEKLRASNAHWSVEVIPNGGQTPEGIPEVDSEDPWAYARQVDSAFVRRMDNPDATPSADHPREAEHYIFYRGLSNQRLPIQVQAERGDRASLRSGFHDAIPLAIALEVNGDRARFRTLGEVSPDTDTPLELGSVEFRPLGDVVFELFETIHEALVAQGLFEDEALAMVRTWSRQWFRSQGHRVIYLVPRSSVESRLPLMVNPAPDSMVRVLVGRLEFLTPEREAAVNIALRERSDDDPAVREGAEKVLEGLGRFLEPHLRRALTSTTDPVIVASAQSMLDQITAPTTENPDEETSTLDLERR
ncbi:MAG: hypothetical protein AAF196_08140 [Planctomycetota bacterium]